MEARVTCSNSTMAHPSWVSTPSLSLLQFHCLPSLVPSCCFPNSEPRTNLSRPAGQRVSIGEIIKRIAVNIAPTFRHVARSRRVDERSSTSQDHSSQLLSVRETLQQTTVICLQPNPS